MKLGVSTMLTNELSAEKYEVDSFNKLVLRDDAGTGAVHIEQGLTECLQIEASLELLRRIEVNVRNGTLYIRLGGSWLERLGDILTTSLTRPKINYRLQVKELQSVALTCASVINIPSLKTGELSMNLCGVTQADIEGLEADRFQIKHSGMGTLQIKGATRKQEVHLNGSSFYNALELSCEHAVIYISGSAQARVFAGNSLDATIRGMGVVKYRGEPHVRQQIFGMGGVERDA
jgi:hypothetical protein